MVEPGDIIDGRWQVGEMLAYQGSPTCLGPRCTRRFAPGDPPEGVCIGWHCPRCEEPTNSYGHHVCKAAEAAA